MNVILDGNLNLSNNFAERTIRSFDVEWKAWYFFTIATLKDYNVILIESKALGD
ncbi:hypothetical protein JOE23_003357 [Amphibacillus cookii]|nr:hypothetical protein [Amphibacillus cookii]